MDFLTFLQKQASAPTSRGFGPGTPGYIASSLGGLTNFEPTPVETPEPTVDEGGGFWDAINPSEIGINLGDIGSRAVDLLSRPSYAVNNMIQEAVRRGNEATEDGFDVGDIGDIWGGFSPGQAWQGLSGQQKVIGQEAIEGIPGFEDQPEALQFIEGLGVDLFADPTTYIGAGAVKSIAKGGISGVKALTNVGKSAAIESKAMDVASSAVKVADVGKPKVNLMPSSTKEVKVSDEVDQAFTPSNKVEPVEVPKAPELEATTPAPKLTTADAPSMAASFSTPIKITPSSKGFIDTVHDFSQVPIPLGRALEPEVEPFFRAGSTTEFNIPGGIAAGNAEESLVDMSKFVDTAKGSTPAQLKQAYDEGLIRPTLDTPAERAMAAAYDLSSLRTTKRVVKSKVQLPAKDYHTTPAYIRQGFRKYRESPIPGGDPISDVGEVFVKSGKGNYVVRDIDMPLLNSALHGRARRNMVRVATGSNFKELPMSQVFVKGYNGKFESLSAIAAQNKRALGSKKYWDDAQKEAQRYLDHPEQLIERIARQNADYLRVTAKDTIDDFAEWSKEVKALVPGLSKESLKAAHDAVKDALNTAWRMTVDSPRKDIKKFLAASRNSQQLRQIMAEAVARHSTPEELVVEAAHVKRNIQIEFLNIDLERITNSALSTEAKATAATKTKLAAEAAEEEVRVAEAAAEQAPNVRMQQAQQSNNPKAAVRDAENYNDLSDGAAGAIEGHSWGKKFTKDQAIGVVRKAVAQVQKTMNKPKNVRKFHQMNQAGVLNTIVGEVAKGEKNYQAFIRKMIRANPEMSAEYGGHIAAAMRAAEHQMDAVGHTPNAWNGARKGAKGWAIGVPGKTQTTRTLSFGEADNIPFSSSKLMDDMISYDFALASRGVQTEDILVRALNGEVGARTPLWTHIVDAALFKNTDALAKIEDKTLRKFLLNYDPSSNVRFASEHYTGKVQQFTQAQSSSAQRAIADSKVKDSPARSARVVDESNEAAEEAIERTPAAPVADAKAIGDQAKLAGKEIDDALDNNTLVDDYVNFYKDSLGRGSNNAAQKVMKEAGSTKATPGQSISNVEFDKPMTSRLNSSFKGILQNIATHVGAENVRPMMQDSFGFVMSTMGNSRRGWNHIAKGLEKATAGDPAKMKMFIASLNPSNKIPAPEGLEELQRLFRKQMETTLGGSGVEKYFNGNTTVTRAGVSMEKVNEWLRVSGVKLKPDDAEHFQFSGAKITDDVGTVYDYGEGNWVKEWETCLPINATPRELAAFMHGVERAVMTATMERHLFDDLAVRFSGRGRTVDHPYLQGVELPEEIAKETERMIDMIDELHKPGKSNSFFNYYDTMLRGWKSGVTIYNPAHHIRNAFGDTFLLASDMGFIESTRSMKQAAALFHKYGILPDEFDTGLKSGGFRLDPEMAKDPEALIKAMTAPVEKGASHIVHKGSGVRVGDDQIMQALNRHGILQPAHQVEDIMEAAVDETVLGKLPQRVRQPFGGNLNEAATRAAEAREHRIRAAHFIAAVKKSKIKRISGESEAQFKKRLFEDAAKRTRKWHPDGSDLTKFERNVMRRLIPFYSWQRKSIPLILEGALRNPHVASAYPKLQREISYSMTGEAVPSDQLFPDFITQGSPMAYFGESVGEGGPEAGYTAAKGPSTPFNDLVPFANNPLAETLRMSTPFARVPIELANRKQMGTDIPLESTADRAEYVAEQVPNLGTLVRNLTNKNPGGNEALNWLLAAGLLDTGEYMGTAYWDRKNAIEQMREGNLGG